MAAKRPARKTSEAPISRTVSYTHLVDIPAQSIDMSDADVSHIQLDRALGTAAATREVSREGEAPPPEVVLDSKEITQRLQCQALRLRLYGDLLGTYVQRTVDGLTQAGDRDSFHVEPPGLFAYSIHARVHVGRAP